VRRAALVVLAALAAAAPAYGDAGGYCVPANTFWDPTDLGTVPTLELPPGVRSRSVTIDGVRVPLLETSARRGGTAVVFLHGNPGSAEDFTDLLGRLTKLRVRVLAFDLPGFGRAAKPWTFAYTGEDYTRWFADAMDRLGVRRAHLVVHDLGGPLGMQWGAEHPRRLLSAVIIDSGVLVGYQDHYLARIWKTPEAGEQFQASVTHESFTTGINNGQQRSLPQPFVDRMYAEYDRPTRCAILSTYRSVADVDAYARKQAAVLSKRRRPALVIWGAHDPYLPTDLAYAQRRAFPGATVHIFDDAAHWPFIDDPEPAAKLVVPFLRRVVR
jgi:pimeloyl-ACP methyl ester carboxylesterase